MVERSFDFIEGFGACKRGLSRTKNPYRGEEDSRKEWQEWHNGWNKAFWGEAIDSDDPDP